MKVRIFLGAAALVVMLGLVCNLFVCNIAAASECSRIVTHVDTVTLRDVPGEGFSIIGETLWQNGKKVGERENVLFDSSCKSTSILEDYNKTDSLSGLLDSEAREHQMTLITDSHSRYGDYYKQSFFKGLADHVSDQKITYSHYHEYVDSNGNVRNW